MLPEPESSETRATRNQRKDCQTWSKRDLIQGHPSGTTWLPDQDQNGLWVQELTGPVEFWRPSRVDILKKQFQTQCQQMEWHHQYGLSSAACWLADDNIQHDVVFNALGSIEIRGPGESIWTGPGTEEDLEQVWDGSGPEVYLDLIIASVQWNFKAPGSGCRVLLVSVERR